MSVAIFQQIAAEIGVSPRTVQRVLNTRLKDTRPAIVSRAVRIRERARQLNYRPNVAAKATASGRFNCISLVRPFGTHESRFSVELSDAIVNELAAHEMYLTLHRLPDEKLAEAGFLPRMLRESMSDGLLVNYTHHIPRQVESAIDRSGIPTIWLNVRRDADCIYPDDVAAGRLATEHLIRKGHRRIAYLRLGGSGHYSEKSRLEGYLAVMRGAGLEPQVREIACPRPEDASRGSPEMLDLRLGEALRWLASGELPEAVVTYSGWTAQPLLSALLCRGLRLGHDIDITTIEDGYVTDAGVPITTVVLDVHEMGRRAVEMLLTQIEGPGTPLSPVAVSGKLLRARPMAEAAVEAI